MSNQMNILDPRAFSQMELQPSGRSLESLSGKVVGFIDNAKPNFNHLIDDLADLLSARYGVARVIKRRKRGGSVPAPEEVLRELSKECDVVITGSGD